MRLSGSKIFTAYYEDPSLLRMLNTKSTISQKLNIVQKKPYELKIPFQNIAHPFLDKWIENLNF